MASATSAPSIGSPSTTQPSAVLLEVPRRCTAAPQRISAQRGEAAAIVVVVRGGQIRPPARSPRPRPPARGRRPATRRTIISLRVRVPVLSEQMTETAPSVSTAGSLRTTALRAAMRRTPIASVMVMHRRQPLGHDADGQRHHRHQRVGRGEAAREHREDEEQRRRRPGSTQVKLPGEAVDLPQRAASSAARPSAISRLMRPISVPPPVATTTPVALPGRDQRAGEGHPLAVAERRVGRHRRLALLGRRPTRRSAAPRRSSRPRAAQQAQVRRHPVAGLDQHHVARHQRLATPTLRARAVAQHRRPAARSCRGSPRSAFSALPSWMKPTMALTTTTTRITAGVDAVAEQHRRHGAAEQDVDQRRC